MAIIRRPAPRRRLGGSIGRPQQNSACSRSRFQCLLRWVLYPPTLLLLLLVAFVLSHRTIGRDDANPQSAISASDEVGVAETKETKQYGGLRRDAAYIDAAPPAAAPARRDEESTKETSSAIQKKTEVEESNNKLSQPIDANVVNEETKNDEGPNDPNKASIPPSVDGWPAECALYLAQSTIPNAGFGLFTAIDLPRKALVGSPDIEIPVIDPDWHNQGHYKDWDYHFVYEDYFWSAASQRLVDVAETIGVMSHGFGAVGNSHQALNNLDEGLARFDSAGLHRSRDVGAGQFSPYHDRQARTSVAIPAGSELFVDYGENWFTSRTGTFGYLPMEDDYNKVDRFLKEFHRFDKSNLLNANAGGPISNAIREEYWDLIRQFYGRNNSRAVNALPNTFADAEVAMEGGIRKVVREIRSPDWFQEHGKCLDNIRPQPSTIRQAGRGAFATRFIPKGNLVIAAPLIQIPQGRDVFKMYAMNQTNAKGDFVRGDLNTSTHVGYQLMMNYAFGHPESSVFLTPYGPSVSFINHNATSANTKLQWADPKHEWLSQSVEWLEKNTTGAQLSFDVIATRDIMPGEEVFLDYGDSWQNRWDGYVQNWSPPTGSEDYVSASDMNAEFDKNGVKGKYGVLRTAKEQQAEPYPSNIIMHCRYSATTLSKLKKGEKVTKVWDKSQAQAKLHPCEILSKHAKKGGRSTSYMYTVKILEHRSRLGKFGNDEKLPGLPRGRHFTLTGVPREAILFGDKLYSNDIFLSNSFRHEIVVPDDIWPESWKNLASVIE